MIQINLQSIAKKSLRACYVDGKIVASPTHFSDFWARDTFWALPGVLAIGDREVAKNCIEYFLSFQRSDGKIPRKISRDINVLKYVIGKSIPRSRPRPVYTALVRPFYSMDDNALLVRAAWIYFDATKDEESLRAWYPRLKRAMKWYDSRVRGGLVYEGLLANWMDTVWKRGAVLYTNVLYCEALRRMARMAGALGNQEDVRLFESSRRASQEGIRKHFWNGAFLEERGGHFDTAGNMLACLFDVVDTEKQRSIVQEFHKQSGNDKNDKGFADLNEMRGRYEERSQGVHAGTPASTGVSDEAVCQICESCFCKTQYPSYPWWRINPVATLFGIADYHNGACWSWVLAVVAAAEKKTGHMDAAKKRIEAFTAVARRDDEIGETYFADGTPYKKRLWKSASPFAWAGGMWISVGSGENWNLTK